MNSNSEIKEHYLSNFKNFENSLNGGSTSPLHQLRKDAIRNFSDLSFPTTKDEEWKYTSIAPLLEHTFVIPDGKAAVGIEEIKHLFFNDAEYNFLVFINGQYKQELSSLTRLPEGVEAGSLLSEIKKESSPVKKYFGKSDYRTHIFTALNTAFIKEGAFIYVPDNTSAEVPIHILYLTLSAGKKLMVQPRNLFVTGKNSRVTIIEHYAGLDEGIYFTNSVTEIVNGANSIIDHIKLQEESIKGFHISRMEVKQDRTSVFSSHFISLGAEFSRNEFNTVFNDEGGECTLNGLFLTGGSQLFDVHTMIDHAKPHCDSHEHYKGILDGRSRGIFNGKVMVRKDAQKTNAFQENNNIILSNEALINTKPQLEIFADDVKCSHGATIGQLDDEAKFYLKSRGIGEETARAILIHAFASDVVKSIKIKGVRDFIEKILTERFNSQ